MSDLAETGEEERPEVQKKVFGRWINAKLKGISNVSNHPHITDLYFDLQDGQLLSDLLASLTGKDVRREQVYLIFEAAVF